MCVMYTIRHAQLVHAAVCGGYARTLGIVLLHVLHKSVLLNTYADQITT
jgi:hypothetical protein